MWPLSPARSARRRPGDQAHARVDVEAAGRRRWRCRRSPGRDAGARTARRRPAAATSSLGRVDPDDAARLAQPSACDDVVPSRSERGRSRHGSASARRRESASARRGVAANGPERRSHEPVRAPRAARARAVARLRLDRTPSRRPAGAASDQRATVTRAVRESTSATAPRRTAPRRRAVSGRVAPVKPSAAGDAAFGQRDRQAAVRDILRRAQQPPAGGLAQTSLASGAPRRGRGRRRAIGDRARLRYSLAAQALRRPAPSSSTTSPSARKPLPTSSSVLEQADHARRSASAGWPPSVSLYRLTLPLTTGTSSARHASASRRSPRSAARRPLASPGCRSSGNR